MTSSISYDNRLGLVWSNLPVQPALNQSQSGVPFLVSYDYSVWFAKQNPHLELTKRANILFLRYKRPEW